MHIIIGMLGSIVTVLWLLHRLAEMGIDLGGLNPWLWQRRRKWKNAYTANPVFTLDKPMEVTGLLITATAKADGDMSAEEKREILEIFENEFHLSKREAAGLLISSAHLLGKGDEVRNDLPKVMAGSLDHFSPEQVKAAVALLRRIAAIGGEPTQGQLEFIDRVSGLFARDDKSKGTWD